MDKAQAIKLLIADEVEAIEGYEKHLDSFTKQEQFIIRQIINDEKRHIEQLKLLKGEN